MITFKTFDINEEEIKEWKFNTIEEILKEWWTNGGINLPFGNEEVIDGKFYINGKEVCATYFDDIITELSITYWSKM